VAAYTTYLLLSQRQLEFLVSGSLHLFDLHCLSLKHGSPLVCSAQNTVPFADVTVLPLRQHLFSLEGRYVHRPHDPFLQSEFFEHKSPALVLPVPPPPSLLLSQSFLQRLLMHCFWHWFLFFLPLQS